MNRVIKFRVHHNGIMYYPDISVYLAIFGRTGQIPWGLYDAGDHHRIVTGDQNAILNQPGNLMQFTGLFDKNGNEVYENDIIKFISHTLYEASINSSETEKIELIEWDSHCAKFKSKTLSGSALSEIPFEVIGNIYETTGLLK